MLRIVKPNRWNHAQYNYEKAVAARIEQFSNKLGYYFLENEVQRWLDLHCADSMDGITARAYIDTLIHYCLRVMKRLKPGLKASSNPK